MNERARSRRTRASTNDSSLAHDARTATFEGIARAALSVEAPHADLPAPLVAPPEGTSGPDAASSPLGHDLNTISVFPPDDMAASAAGDPPALPLSRWASDWRVAPSMATPPGAAGLPNVSNSADQYFPDLVVSPRRGAGGAARVQRQGDAAEPVSSPPVLPAPSLLSGDNTPHLPVDQLQLDPQIQAMALVYAQQQLAPANLLPALARMQLGTPPPTSGPAAAASAGATSTGASQQPGRADATPRAGSSGDVMHAILALPEVHGALDNLQHDVADQTQRDWARLGSGERVVVVSTLALISAGALGGVLANPSARQWAAGQLNGHVFPVPGLNWLGLELNITDQQWKIGAHVNVGALLPRGMGFGGAASGGPPPPVGSGSPSVQPARESGGPGGAPDLAQRLRAAAATGSPLEPGVQRRLEAGLGGDLARVRVHTDGEADALSRAVGATAFTTGADIFFRQGAYAPASPAGLHLLAHEATHTLQQAAGPVAGTPAPGGVALSDPADPFEQAAEATAARLVAGFAGPAAGAAHAPSGSLPAGTAAPVQRQAAANEVAPDAPPAPAAEEDAAPAPAVVAENESAAPTAATSAAPGTDASATSAEGAEQAPEAAEPLGAADASASQAPEATTDESNVPGAVSDEALSAEAASDESAAAGGAGGASAAPDDAAAAVEDASATPAAGGTAAADEQPAVQTQRVGSASVAVQRSWLGDELHAVGGDLARGASAVEGAVEQGAEWTFKQALTAAGIPADALLGFLHHAGSAVEQIFAHPGAFLTNLLAAVKGGFRQFAANIGVHLEDGLVGWLTGALGSAGIQAPPRLDAAGIFSLVLQVLGLTPEHLRAKLGQLIGAQNLGRIEAAWSIITQLIHGGLGGLWEHAKEYVGDLTATVLGQIKDWAITKIVQQAVVHIVGLFNPAGAVVEVLSTIWDVIKFLRDRGPQLLAVFQRVTESLAAIAAGSIGGAANAVERTLASGIAPLLAFLADLIGLGDIAAPIRRIIDAIRAPIDAAIDKVLGVIARGVKGIASRIGGAVRGVTGRSGAKQGEQESDEEKNERLQKGLDAGTRALERFAGRRVGSMVLRPILAVIRLRYRMQVLEPVEREGRWALHGIVNPSDTVPTPVLSVEQVVYHGRTEQGEQLIIDTNMGIALEKFARDPSMASLQPGERTMVNRAQAMKIVALLTPTGVLELGRGALRSTITRKSSAEEEQRIFGNLSTAPMVGGGEQDRRIVLEALLAEHGPGVIPTFASADRRIINGLAHRSGIDVRTEIGPYGNVATFLLHERQSDRFTVTIEGRPLIVVPIQPIHPR